MREFTQRCTLLLIVSRQRGNHFAKFTASALTLCVASGATFTVGATRLRSTSHALAGTELVLEHRPNRRDRDAPAAQVLAESLRVNAELRNHRLASRASQEDPEVARPFVRGVVGKQGSTPHVVRLVDRK